MSRRDKAGGKAVKTRRSTTSTRRNAPKAAHHGAIIAELQDQLDRRTRELNETLQQQAATGEVLGVIRRSPADAQPVFDIIGERAEKLCDADVSVVSMVDGDLIQLASIHGVSSEGVEAVRNFYPFGLGRDTVTSRTVHTAGVVHVSDVLADPTYEAKGAARTAGYRACLGVPMIRDERVIGTIFVGRKKAEPYTDNQIQLLRTFADQAVIAIENARLLNELRQSLERQTATADVLKIISSSPGALDPVFKEMLEKATQICGASFGTLLLFEGNAFRRVAAYNAPHEYVQFADKEPFIRLDRARSLDRLTKAKEPVQIADMAEAEPNSPLTKLGGARTYFAVPMLKENELIGAIGIYRQEVRPFTDKQIELVQNFAAQAVIAIENARLLDDLNKLNQQLEQRVSDQVGEIERMGRLRRFLPPQVADLIVASGAEKQLESHRREITALFCDLRGFTGFSESSDPEDVMALLSDYHAAIGEIIIKYSGTLERYAGDGVMVIFNDPVPVPNPALQAVKMALDMRAAIGALIEKWRRLGHDLGFGIGIAHGFATLGTIGFEGRFDYAAIGTVSNVASRLCDEAKPGQILISPRVLLAIEDAITVEAVGEFELKGIRRPMTAYNVLAAKLAN